MSHHDPGWNDPPTFSYTASVGPKRTLLNKRVSFPVSPVPNATNSSCSPFPVTPISLVNMNSPVFLPSVPPVAQINNIDNTKQNLNVVHDTGLAITASKGDEELLSYILSVFDGVVSKTSENSELLTERKIEDIKGRLKTFQEMWAATLSPLVKQKMFKLAEDLYEKKYNEAYALHCSLIVDHVSEVSQWMVAVKHIIQIAKSFDGS